MLEAFARRTPLPFIVGLTLAAMFAALPVLWYGYTYPPTIFIEGMGPPDPLVLESRLSLDVHGYYGHFPAWLLGMHLYYRLAPVFAFLGLWALLRRYGPATPILAWVALFLICRTLAFDLRNGTFVGVINFWFIGLIMLRYVALWAEGKVTWRGPAALAIIAVPFHAFTGLVLWTGVILHWAIFRKPHTLFTASLLGVGVLVSWTLLGSSVAKLEFLPFVAAAPVIESEVGQFVQAPALTISRFVLEYMGVGVLTFWLLGLVSVWGAWRTGWRPTMDLALMALALMLPFLLLMTFSPLALNADRTAKLMVGIITLLAAVGVVRGLAHLKDWRLTATVATTTGIILLYSLPQLIPYYLEMGSFR